MRRWLEERVAEIRVRMVPGDEASLWALLFDDAGSEPLMATAIDGAMNEMTPELLGRWVSILEALPVRSVLFAVIRQDGRPRVEDRQLWCDLQARLPNGSMDLLGFVVVGPARYWTPKDTEPDVAA